MQPMYNIQDYKIFLLIQKQTFFDENNLTFPIFQELMLLGRESDLLFRSGVLLRFNSISFGETVGQTFQFILRLGICGQSRCRKVSEKPWEMIRRPKLTFFMRSKLLLKFFRSLKRPP
jgi:hypothetical protein